MKIEKEEQIEDKTEEKIEGKIENKIVNKMEDKIEDKIEEKEIQPENNIQKRRRKGYAGWLVLGAAVGVLLLIYVGVVFYYKTHFFPGTVINGRDYGNAGLSEAAEGLVQALQDYNLRIIGRDPAEGDRRTLASVSAADVGLQASLEMEEVEGLMKQQNEWVWPKLFWRGEYQYVLKRNISIDSGKLEAFLDAQPAFQAKNMKMPRNAYIKGYSGEQKCFVLEPDVRGTQLDLDKAVQAIVGAMEIEAAEIDLEEQGCYAEPSITAENADLQNILTEVNKYLQTQITYDWNGNEVILDADTIKDWIKLGKNEIVINEVAVAAFVKENAKQFDTYKKIHSFTTVLGIELELPGGAFGWLTDRDAETEELLGLIKEGAVVAREPVYASRGAGKGDDDIGDSYVEVDLSHQHLYLYQDGEVVLETDFVSGNMSNGCKTPPGVFGLTYKTKNAVLRGADYATPVNYWMPFNGNVGMHDATWRGSFGGNIYLTSGSHGCINLPLGKAAEIYEYVSTGFPVICYYYPDEILAEMEPQTQIEYDPWYIPEEYLPQDYIPEEYIPQEYIPEEYLPQDYVPEETIPQEPVL